MRSNLEKNYLERVKINCLNFYIESILMRFLLKDSVFEKIKCMDPESVKSRKISHISKLFPNLLAVDILTIDNEWLTPRNFKIHFKTNYHDICEFWKYIAVIKNPDTSASRFPNFSKFVLIYLLCLFQVPMCKEYFPL